MAMFNSYVSLPECRSSLLKVGFIRSISAMILLCIAFDQMILFACPKMMASVDVAVSPVLLCVLFPCFFIFFLDTICLMDVTSFFFYSLHPFNFIDFYNILQWLLDLNIYIYNLYIIVYIYIIIYIYVYTCIYYMRAAHVSLTRDLGDLFVAFCVLISWNFLTPRRRWAFQQGTIRTIRTITGWWFGTFFIFHNIWDNPSHWLMFFRVVITTNQIK